MTSISATAAGTFMIGGDAPYDGRMTVATKGGFTRHGPGIWKEVGRREYLRQCALMSIRRRKVDAIDLYQLHRIDPRTDRDEQFSELKALQDEGLVRHLGLSEVSVEEIKAAQQVFEVATVQVAGEVPGDAADPRHGFGRAPRGERRCRRVASQRRRADDARRGGELVAREDACASRSRRRAERALPLISIVPAAIAASRAAGSSISAPSVAGSVRRPASAGAVSPGSTSVRPDAVRTVHTPSSSSTR
jgi:Aldo/keto reductase family